MISANSRSRDTVIAITLLATIFFFTTLVLDYKSTLKFIEIKFIEFKLMNQFKCHYQFKYQLWVYYSNLIKLS